MRRDRVRHPLALALGAMIALGLWATASGGLDLALGQGVGLRLLGGSIDAGSPERATGGGYALSAAIGQPDAGRLEGGGITLRGGVLFPRIQEAAPIATPTSAPSEPTPTVAAGEPSPTATRPVFRVADTIFLPRTVRGE